MQQQPLQHVGLAQLQQELTAMLAQAKKEIQAATALPVLQQLRVHYLGKSGKLTELLKSVGRLPKEERPEIGKTVNVVKADLETYFEQQEIALQAQQLQAQLSQETIDVTLPGRCEDLGSVHPVTRARDRAVALLMAMGFSVAEGPEIEDDYHNFSALNFAKHHPARNEQDTFYFANGQLLRTHTSTVQIRVMETQKPPLRIATPGRVYRRDSDATHTPMFHQLEVLVVDRVCTFANLKALLKEFFSRFFEKEVKLRFRPSYFPFTEPSAEVDVYGESGWLEVLGCGMVHPNVLRNVNINPDEFSGYAFGLGLDRMAMLRYGIHDLRMMFENDLRFLEQF